MNKRYQRVEQSEKLEEQDKKKKADRIERIISKLHAFVWVSISIVIIVYTEIFRITFTDERVNRISLNAAIVCFVANFFIVLYLTIWLPLVLKVTTPWEIYCPQLIPISTALGILFFILLIISLWPIYGLLTPILLGILSMGFLFSAHFIPWPC